MNRKFIDETDKRVAHVSKWLQKKYTEPKRNSNETERRIEQVMYRNNADA